MTEPVAATVSRAAALFGCDPGRLAKAIKAAQVPVFAFHADGSECHRWPETVAAAVAAGIQVPRSLVKTRPTMAAWKTRQETRAGRKRRSDARLRAKARSTRGPAEGGRG